MKISVWDVLTGVVLLSIVCLAGAFTQIFINPAAAFNPLKPPTAMPTIFIPTATETSRVMQLPPTWTPTPPETVQVDRATLRPSSTLPPTITPFTLPSFTPSVTVTPTATATRIDTRCSVVDESPLDDAQFTPNQEFDKRWVLRNNSSSTWSSDNVDVRFVGGIQLQTGSSALDLAHDVSSGSTIDIIVRMRAPSTPGEYVTNWSVVTGDQDLCRFFAKITVR